MSAPEFPRHVSASGAEIWDWAAKLSAHTQRLDRMAKLRADLNKTLRCGDCYWWMKSRDCPREHNVNGRNHGPSMNAYTCGKFQETAQSIELRGRKMAELAELQEQSS